MPKSLSNQYREQIALARANVVNLIVDESTFGDETIKPVLPALYQRLHDVELQLEGLRAMARDLVLPNEFTQDAVRATLNTMYNALIHLRFLCAACGGQHEWGWAECPIVGIDEYFENGEYDQAMKVRGRRS